MYTRQFQVEAQKLLMHSLRRRVVGLPEVLTARRFQLKPSKRLTALHKLVTLRNELLHIDEAATTVDGKSQAVNLNADTLEVHVPMPPDYWGGVSVVEAEFLLNTVELYLREIIESDRISNSSLLRAPR